MLRRPALVALLTVSAACGDPRGRPAPTAASRGVATATLPAVASAIPPAPPDAVPARALETCADAPAAAIFTSPRDPRPGEPLRIIAVTTKPLDAALVVRDANGGEIARTNQRRGGGPYAYTLNLAAPAAGGYRALVSDGREVRACEEVAVDEVEASQPRSWALWPVTEAWGEATENFYSAWIEALFDAPPGEPLTFAALHDALRNPRRNLLHDHLGRGEDDPGPDAPILDPDCADLPYALRAYFAFKVGLPFTYSSCTRGGGGKAPRCKRFRSSLEAPRRTHAEPMSTFAEFLRTTLADTVHSGTGRTAGDDDQTDYYPVRLDEGSLRPGTIYADPYGHVLVVVRRTPQTSEHAGMLLAVDGQPDGTVARRRYWRGNFLFALDPSLGAPGFKRFRPLVMDDKRRLRAMSNRDITESPAYSDHSLEQYERGVEGLYDRVDDVLSPLPLDPERAVMETLDALFEQVRGRVLSVDNGRKYRQGGGESVEMPEGSKIFETVGPWEDFSTPSRDLRLLVAIDVLRGLPARVERRPERFAMPAGKTPAEVRASLEATIARELSTHRFSYERSDGSTFSLSLADVVGRAEALEMAYNPNDCPEARWGAPEGTDEASTCRMHAPWKQRSRMRKVRKWFKERKRPPRGF